MSSFEEWRERVLVPLRKKGKLPWRPWNSEQRCREHVLNLHEDRVAKKAWDDCGAVKDEELAKKDAEIAALTRENVELGKRNLRYGEKIAALEARLSDQQSVASDQ